MIIIPQQTFFVWDEIENLGDLERLQLVPWGLVYNFHGHRALNSKKRKTPLRGLPYA